MAVVILSIIKRGWNVFVSSIFKGIDKALNGINPIDRDLDNEAEQYTNNINKNAPAGLETTSNQVIFLHINRLFPLKMTQGSP